MSRGCLPISRLVLGAALALALAGPAAAADGGFRGFVEGIVWPEAEAAGVSRAVFDAAFEGVAPDLTLPELALPNADAPPAVDQAEFRSPALYFGEANLAALTRTGRAMAAAWRQTLAAVVARYGVPAGILLAVWGRESTYGSVSDPENAIVALATEAYLGRRPESFRAELIAALRILQRGDVTPARMKSSWAGGLGQPQFLPSTYLDYAVDFDGDGRADIWDSVPDLLASIANYLSRHGWDHTRGWGLEIRLPADISCTLEGPDRDVPLAAWQLAGVTLADGSAFGRSGDTVYHLLMPAGRLGPAFLVTPNFQVIKSYNNSDLYALYVGALADRITLADMALRTPWQPLGSFTQAQVATMQRALMAAGFDVGGADGLVGVRTRVALGIWQSRNGLAITCYPDAALLRRFE